MSVLIVTSVGDIVVDLHADRCPLTAKNFLKLCKMKYYNGCLFHRVEKDFTAQTGDRTGTGTGGDSVYKFLYGDQARFFEDEIHPDLKHSKTGTIAMASAGENCNASQFYFTLRDDLDYLDGKHTIFGVVEEKEGLETLAKISEAYVDNEGRPFKDIRIKHTYILDDPFEDPPQLAEFIPENSPEGKPHDEIAEERLEDNWVPLDETLGPTELEEVIRVKEAHTNAAILESIGDIPDADIKPPENVLFVCKLNPVTQDEDLFTIFSRFGTVVSADIIRDYKTGDSLCYAFIEFETKEACERAYFKMDNTLIDDRRIHVDFSQSVSKLWGQYRHGKGTNGNKGGCFKCGSTDHIAKDCDQDTINKQNAPKYLLKDDSRDGDERQRYEMVFDADDLGDAGGQERAKKRRVYHGRPGLSTHKSSDKKSSDRRRHNFDGRRGSREPEWSEGGKSDAEHHGSKRVESRAEERYDDREHRKRHEVSRERDVGYYRSNLSKSRENEGLHSDRRRRDEGDYGRREDRDSQRRDAGKSEKKSKYSEDERHREKHRDHRNNGHYEKRSKDHDDGSCSVREHRDHGMK